MDSRIETAVGPDEDMVAKRHLRLIEHREIEVGKEMLANLDVTAIVAVHWRDDKQILACRAKELGDATVARVNIALRHLVDFKIFLLRVAKELNQPSRWPDTIRHSSSVEKCLNSSLHHIF